MLSIMAIPTAVDFLKATDFVQTMTLAINLEAGNEFNCAGDVIRPACLSGTYAGSQPTPPGSPGGLCQDALRDAMWLKDRAHHLAQMRSNVTASIVQQSAGFLDY